MKTWMKKMVCMLVVTGMFFAVQTTAFAVDDSKEKLQFDADGRFTILHMTDWHTSYPMQAIQKQYALEAIASVDPDLAVLGGDMSEADAEQQPMAVKEICDLFVQAGVPFAITFGNHDYLHGLSIDEMFALYKEYGGAYCLSEDEDPDLFGCGTCSIPVYAHDGGRIAYNIYCFDSGCEYNRNDYKSNDPDRTKQFGRSADEVIYANHDSVHPDQIEWYKHRAEELKAANDGKYVPSMVFQHIIVQEIYDKIWLAAKENDRNNVVFFNEKSYKMKAIPNLSCVKDGYIMERPCPGYYNYGQMDAMQKNGDVKAIVCGHDHSNSFTVEINGVDIINTPSVKPHSLFKKMNWGSRVITLHEDGTYESRVLAGYALAGRSGSGIIASGGISRLEIAFTKVWKSFVDASLIFWKPVTKVFYGSF